MMLKDITEKLKILLTGKIPEKIAINGLKEDNYHENKNSELIELIKTVNKLIDFMGEVHNFIVPLSKGKLTNIKTSHGNFLASPFKELHSRLLHLTWQAKQVAMGDYSQRVDFMGEFSEAFNTMIVSLEKKEKELTKKIEELEKALSHIENLEGILPICANCKKIRIEGSDPDEPESWVQIENYISKKTRAEFSHSLCPECMKKLYPEIYKKSR